jgi:hypothetical protein
LEKHPDDDEKAVTALLHEYPLPLFFPLLLLPLTLPIPLTNIRYKENAEELQKFYQHNGKIVHASNPEQTTHELIEDFIRA